MEGESDHGMVEGGMGEGMMPPEIGESVSSHTHGDGMQETHHHHHQHEQHDPHQQGGEMQHDEQDLGGEVTGGTLLAGYEWREVRLVPFTFNINSNRLPVVSAYVPAMGDRVASQQGSQQKAYLALQPLVDFLGCQGGSPAWRNIRRAAGLSGHLMEVPEVPASFNQDCSVRDWLKKKRKESRWELIDLEGIRKIHINGGMLIPSTICGPAFNPTERRQVLALLEKLAEFAMLGKESLAAAFGSLATPVQHTPTPLFNSMKLEGAMGGFGQGGSMAWGSGGGGFGDRGGGMFGGPNLPAIPLSVAANMPSLPFGMCSTMTQPNPLLGSGGLVGPAPGPGSFAHALFASPQRDALAPSQSDANMQDPQLGDKRRQDEISLDPENSLQGMGGSVMSAAEKRQRYDLGPKPPDPKAPDAARSPYIMYKEYCMDRAKQEGRNPGEAGRAARQEWDRAGCGSELHQRWEVSAREDSVRYNREIEAYSEAMREVAIWETQDYIFKLKMCVDDNQEEPLRIIIEEVQRKIAPGCRLALNEMNQSEHMQQLHAELTHTLQMAASVSRNLTLNAGSTELTSLLEKLRRAAYAQDLDELRRSLQSCDAFNRKYGSALRSGAPEKAQELDAAVDAAMTLQKRLQGDEADRRMCAELKRMSKGKRDDELVAHARDYRECVESCVALLQEVGRLWDERARVGHRTAQEQAHRHQQGENSVKTVKKAIAKALRDQIVLLPNDSNGAPRTVSASSANVDEALFRKLFPEATSTTYMINQPTQTFAVSNTYFSKNLRNGGYISMDSCTAQLLKDGTLKVSGIGKRAGSVN